MAAPSVLPYPNPNDEPQTGVLRALRHKNYRLFFGGQLISLVGTFLTQMATIWFVYRLTKDTRLLGIVGFAGQLPLFVLAPFAGVWADRVNRQKFLVLTQTLSMFQSAALAVLAFEFANKPDIAVPALIALAIIQGLINAFDLPARQAFLVEMVTDRADLANAIALNSTMVHGARLIGPAAAGLLIAWVGEGLCFTIDAVSYIAVIAALVAMRVQPRPPKEHGSVMAELKEGAKYVWQFKPVRVLLILMALISLTIMPALTTLMPIFGDHFGAATGHGAQSFGFLGTASGLGALTASIYLATRKTVVGLGRLIALAVGVFSIAAMGLASVDHFWLALLMIPFIGWGMITSFASSNTIIQMLTDDDKRGRVMSFFAMAFVGMTPFGNLAAGYIAHRLSIHTGDQFIGAQKTIFLAACVCLIGGVFYARVLPAMRDIVRPIYIKKGILPELAAGLNAVDEIVEAGEQK